LESVKPPDSLEAMSILGHELRRPLTVIRGAASMLLEPGDKLPPERARQMLQLIESNAAAMSELIEDVLLACQLDAGQLELELAPVSARRLAESALAAVRLRAGERPIKLELPSGEPRVRADGERAGIVLRALLDNAIQVSPDGQLVELAVREEAGLVRMEVRDRGPGLPTAEAEEAFERFGRLGEGGRGAGLGLYLARGLARSMGGEVGMEARPDGGSVFWFSLNRDG
jgi:two-component system, OmpR family, sensor histidine kinase KdpD